MDLSRPQYGLVHICDVICENPACGGAKVNRTPVIVSVTCVSNVCFVNVIQKRDNSSNELENITKNY